jgi:hypothetical protein
MCTYLTIGVDLRGSGKGAQGWFDVTRGSIYVDHPQHARQDHTLNIDFLNPDVGPAARVAVELTEQSARALAQAILDALDVAPPGLAAAPTPTPPPLSPPAPPLPSSPPLSPPPPPPR